MSEKRLAEIRERLEKATPGPWDARLGSGQNVCTGIASDNPVSPDEFVCDVLPDYACRRGSAPRWENNFRFIVSAPADIAFLLDELSSAREAALLEAARAVCYFCGNGHGPVKHDAAWEHRVAGDCFGCHATAIHDLRAKK